MLRRKQLLTKNINKKLIIASSLAIIIYVNTNFPYIHVHKQVQETQLNTKQITKQSKKKGDTKNFYDNIKTFMNNLKVEEMAKISMNKLQADAVKAEEDKIAKEEASRDWINIIATAYSATVSQCGKDDKITASGVVAQEGITIAAPSDLEMNTKLFIKDLGKTFIIQDRGSRKYIRRINSNTIRIDVYFESKQDAIAFGVQQFKGYIVS